MTEIGRGMLFPDRWANDGDHEDREEQHCAVAAEMPQIMCVACDRRCKNLPPRDEFPWTMIDDEEPER